MLSKILFIEAIYEISTVDSYCLICDFLVIHGYFYKEILFSQYILWIYNIISLNLYKPRLRYISKYVI